MQQQQVQPVPAAAPALPVFTRAAAPITRSESRPAAKDKAKRRKEEEAEVLPSAGEAIPVRVTLLHIRVQVFARRSRYAYALGMACAVRHQQTAL